MKGTMSLKHRRGTSNRKYTALNRYEVDTYKQKIPTNLSLNLKNELTDFDKLLTHHDHRVASDLDAQYLKEEWEFPEVRYKDTKFKDSTVICGDSRVEMTNHQKQSYRHLRSEVGRSEKTVHCAKGGFVRERPVTAPNIGMYSRREMEELKRKQSMRAQSAIYQKLQDLVRHAYKSKDKGIQPVSMSDRPVVADYKPSHIPHVVSDSDLKKTVEDWEQLLFDIETEEGRYEIAMDTEMEHFIPNFKQKKEEMERSKSALSQGAPHVKKKCVSVNKQKNRYEDSVNALAYPAPRLPPSHSRRCDAREKLERLQNMFRGWYAARSKKGPHYVLMSPYFHDSPKGKLFQKLAKMSDAEIQKLHGDLLYRKTKSVDLDQRPVTAPAVMTMEEYRAKMKENDALLKGRNAGKSTGSGNIVKPHVDFKTDEINDIRIVEKEVDERVKSPEPTELDDIVENVDESKCSLDSSVTDKIKEIAEEKVDKAVKTGKQRALSAYAHRQDHLKDEKDSVYLSGQEGRYPRSKSAAEVHHTEAIEDVAPMPYMDHSKPKIVSVGSIGKISLLESISEAKFWEDLAIKQQKEKNKQSSEIAAKSERDDSGTESIGEDAADDALITEKIASQSKKKNSKNKMHSDEMLKDTDILSLILEDEKALKKKIRKYQKKSKFDYSTARSWSSGSSRASKLGSANSRSSSSSGIRSGTPGTPGASVKENCLSPDPCQAKSDSQNANQVHSKLEDKATSAKKKVIVSDSNDTSKANIKPKVSKYERLVNRLGDDLTPYMKHQMMKITV